MHRLLAGYLVFPSVLLLGSAPRSSGQVSRAASDSSVDMVSADQRAAPSFDRSAPVSGPIQLSITWQLT